MDDSGTQTEEPVDNSAEISALPTDHESSPSTDSPLISAPPTAPESPLTSGPHTAPESSTPTGAHIIFGSPSIPRVHGVSHLPALRNVSLRPELLQLPEFYPAPRLPAQLTMLEDSQNPKARYVREPPNLPQSREMHQLARTADCLAPSVLDTPSTAEEETFDFLKWRLHAQLECLLCVEIMVPPIMVCKNGHMICHNCRPKLDRCPLCR